MTERPDLSDVQQIIFTGQPVTLERGGAELIVPNAWIATGWEQGLPVARKPVSESEVYRLISLYPYTVRP